jgi:hypothetical protein
VSKKFIFSAVALIAFSFAGMANEVTTEKFEVEQTSQSLLKKLDCFSYAIGALWAYEQMLGEVTDTHAATILNDAYGACWSSQNP